MAAAILNGLLTAHPDAEFVQMQLNYADWENPDVTAHENYEVARRHGKSIVVMEPVKGGAPANPPTAVQEVFREAWGQLEEGRRRYAETVKNGGRASDCIACGQCERACPQQINVITRLKDCAAQFD